MLAKVTNDVISVRFLTYCLVGAAGIGVHMLALYIGIKAIGLSFNIAQITATLLAITSNFVLNNSITFNDLRLHGLRFLLGWAKFTIICGIGALSNIGIAGWLFEQNGEWSFAGLAGAVVGVFWNFMVSAIFVWRVR